MIKINSEMKALGLGLGAYVCWALGDAATKGATRSPLPLFEIVGISGFFMTLFLVARAFVTGKKRDLWPENPRLVILRSTINVVNNVCNCLAWTYLPLANFYVVAFVAPMFIAVGGVIFLREPLSWQKILIFVASFAGVVVAVDPWSSQEAGSWIGYAAVLGGVLAFTVTQLMLRHLSKTEKPDSLVFMNAFFCFLAGVGSVLWNGFVPVGDGPLMLLGGAAVTSLCGNFAMAASMKMAPAAVVASLHYSQIIPGALLGYLFWGDQPTANLCIGAVIIAVAGLAMAREVQKKS